MPQVKDILHVTFTKKIGLTTYTYINHIVFYDCLHIGNSLLPSHSFKLGLNDSPFCTFYSNERFYDLPYIPFDCSAG